MKTPEEIKKALAMCEDLNADCNDCPYNSDERCHKNFEVLEYIEQLEERIARQKRKNEEKQGYIELLEERIDIMEEGQKHGAWIDQGENPDSFMGAPKSKCSECGYEVWAAFADQLHFCANCGAKMEVNDEERLDG